MIEYKYQRKGANKMKKRYLIIFFIFLIVIASIWFITQKGRDEAMIKRTQQTTGQDTITDVEPTTSLTQLEEGLSVIRYDGDYGFQGFIDAGGATSDEDVLDYLMNHVVDVSGLDIVKGLFGCSTIQATNTQQDILFGRNFDWENSEALILESHPVDAYASITTVNLDFIQSGTSVSIERLPDDVLAQVAMYAPLDGMNEKGLVISVNMIQDSNVIEQNKSTQDLTTTTAIRLILNQAADVDEAITLLRAYDMHSSMGMMIHFAIADAKGNSVVVEYINNEMNVMDTRVVTNFYLSPGEKQGIGTSQSHERYEILMDLLDTNQIMNMEQVRDALNRVSKDNFSEFESTEWSIVYNLNQREIHYYHRENYEQRYLFQLNK